MVLQHRLNRNDNGSCWLHLSDTLKPARSIFSAMVRDTILLHRRGTGLLLSRDIRHRERPDQYLWPRVLATAAESRARRLYHLRCCCDHYSGRWRSSCWICVLESQRSHYTERYTAGWACIPGLFVRSLPGDSHLGAAESTQESGKCQQGLPYSFDRCNTSGLSQDMLQARRDS